MKRYRALLSDLLQLDIAYIVINNPDDGKIAAADFCGAVRGLRAIGGAISKDIKGTVVPVLDEVEERAAQIGAVNTVIRRGDRLVGYNTDAAGFEVAIRAGIKGMVIKSAVCYGYGGVTACVVAVLQSMEIEVFVTGRRPDAARKRAGELGCQVFDPDRHVPELFVNAAPVTDHAPLTEVANFVEALQSCQVAFDHELEGKALVEYCDEHGIKHIPGKSMYWPQMAAQWRIFLQGRIPQEQLDALPELLEQAEASVTITAAVPGR